MRKSGSVLLAIALTVGQQDRTGTPASSKTKSVKRAKTTPGKRMELRRRPSPSEILALDAARAGSPGEFVDFVNAETAEIARQGMLQT